MERQHPAGNERVSAHQRLSKFPVETEYSFEIAERNICQQDAGVPLLF